MEARFSGMGVGEAVVRVRRVVRKARANFMFVVGGGFF